MSHIISKGLLAMTVTAAIASAVTWTQMARADDSYIGTVRFFGFDYAPRGWAACDGQLMTISQNDALFSLLGTIYGGDGRTTFGLPDMRGRIPVHAGSGPGLTKRTVGEKGGSESVTLTASEIGHSHAMQGNAAVGNQSTPTAHALAEDSGDTTYLNEAPTVAMHSASVSASTAGGGAHENRPPSLAVNCSIALVGIYPSRN